jgi:hypothetical protein
VAALERLASVRDLRCEHDELVFTLDGDRDTLALTRALADGGVGIVELVREQTTLEELFFRLTEPEDGEQAEATAA